MLRSIDKEGHSGPADDERQLAGIGLAMVVPLAEGRDIHVCQPYVDPLRLRAEPHAGAAVHPLVLAELVLEVPVAALRTEVAQDRVAVQRNHRVGEVAQGADFLGEGAAGEDGEAGVVGLGQVRVGPDGPELALRAVSNRLPGSGRLFRKLAESAIDHRELTGARPNRDRLLCGSLDVAHHALVVCPAPETQRVARLEVAQCAHYRPPRCFPTALTGVIALRRIDELGRPCAQRALSRRGQGPHGRVRPEALSGLCCSVQCAHRHSERDELHYCMGVHASGSLHGPTIPLLLFAGGLRFVLIWLLK